MESLPIDIKVIGINDYIFLDGYEKVLEYKKRGRLKNIELILPVIELRIKEFVGNAQLNRINYHIIFADESVLATNVIQTHFIAGLTAKANLSPEYTDVPSWAGVVTKESLIDLGERIYNTMLHEKRGKNNFLEMGFNNVNFEISLIKDLLGEGSKPNTFLKGNYFKAIGKVEWEVFRWDGSPAEKKTIINDAHFVFSASPTVEQALNGERSLKEQQVNYRLFHCSDAHRFCDDKANTQSKELGHCYTWIKATQHLRD